MELWVKYICFIVRYSFLNKDLERCSTTGSKLLVTVEVKPDKNVLPLAVGRRMHFYTNLDFNDTVTFAQY